ncbi:MAG: D-sedoheptulose-7-phosphate isomerase [Armatimonadota bacterium]
MLHVDHLDELFTRYPALLPCRLPIEQAAEALIACFRSGGKLLLAGNGGSAADCLHIAGELLKGFQSTRPLSAEDRDALAALFGEEGGRLGAKLQRGLPAIALPAELALTSAMANDVDAALIYAQGVLALGQPGDVLLCLSTSGAAKNVIAAARTARWRGLKTIALTGKDGGELAAVCDLAIVAPGATTAQIQEHHLPIYHALCATVEAQLFGDNPGTAGVPRLPGRHGYTG